MELLVQSTSITDLWRTDPFPVKTSVLFQSDTARITGMATPESTTLVLGEDTFPQLIELLDIRKGFREYGPSVHRI